MTPRHMSISWQRLTPKDRFLITGAAIIQRAVTALPPEVSRGVVDDRGEQSRIPFAVLPYDEPANDHLYLFVWLAALRSQGQHGPARPYLCGVAVNSSGLRFLSRQEILALLEQYPVKDCLTGACRPEELKIFPEELAAKPHTDPPASVVPEPPQSVPAAPPWYVKIVRKHVDQFFDNAPLRDLKPPAKHTFYNSAAAPYEPPAPLTDTDRAGLRRRLEHRPRKTPGPDWEKDALYRGNAPFYRDYEIIWAAQKPGAAGLKLKPCWVLPVASTDSSAPLECPADRDALSNFNAELDKSGRLVLDDTSCAAYLRYVLALSGRRFIEDPRHLLDYPEWVRKGLTSHIRPPVLLLSTPGEWLFASFIDYLDDIFLGLWRVSREGKWAPHGEELIWASPLTDRDLRSDARPLQPSSSGDLPRRSIATISRRSWSSSVFRSLPAGRRSGIACWLVDPSAGSMRGTAPSSPTNTNA